MLSTEIRSIFEWNVLWCLQLQLGIDALCCAQLWKCSVIDNLNSKCEIIHVDKNYPFLHAAYYECVCALPIYAARELFACGRWITKSNCANTKKANLRILWTARVHSVNDWCSTTKLLLHDDEPYSVQFRQYQKNSRHISIWSRENHLKNEKLKRYGTYHSMLAEY